MGFLMLYVTYWLLLNQIGFSTEDVISEGLELQRRNVLSYFLNGALGKVFSLFGGLGMKWLKNFAANFQSLDTIIKLLNSILQMPAVKNMLSKIPGLVLQAVLAGTKMVEQKSVQLRNNFKEYSYLQGVADGDFVTIFMRFYKVPQIAGFIKNQIQSDSFQNLLNSFKNYSNATKAFLGNVLPNETNTPRQANSSSVIGTAKVYKAPVTIPPLQFGSKPAQKWSRNKYSVPPFQQTTKSSGLIGFFRNLMG